MEPVSSGEYPTTPLETFRNVTFATGGDTARCLLEALDVEALEPVRELESGVPLSIAIGPRRFPVITKAGAFGTDATMTRCRLLLRRGAPLAAMQISESEG